MGVSLIAAMAANRAIGLDNRLPWHLSADLKRFRALTTGHPVVMGRKTYESIGRLLPHRLNVILTRQPDFRVEGAEIAATFAQALTLAGRAPGGSEIFVIGGAEIYRLALPRADRLYLTLVEESVAGDAFFPEWQASEFRETSSEAGEEAGKRYRFVNYERVTAR